MWFYLPIVSARPSTICTAPVAMISASTVIIVFAKVQTPLKLILEQSVAYRTTDARKYDVQSANENIVDALNRFGDDGSAWTNLATLLTGLKRPQNGKAAFSPISLLPASRHSLRRSLRSLDNIAAPVLMPSCHWGLRSHASI